MGASKRITIDRAPAVGVVQYGIEGADSAELLQLRTMNMLFRCLNTGRVLGVLGSGVSAGYGFPGWTDLTKRVVLATLAKDRPRPLPALSMTVLKSFVEGGKRSLVPSQDRALLVLQECRDACETEEQFQSVVREALGKASRTPGTMEILIDRLGIRRYLTLNYDTTADEALKSRARFVSSRSPRPEEALAFAAGATPFDAGAWHVHGMLGQELVLSLADYHRRYVSADGQLAREALGLALAASPVLFVGVGLDEPDVLRRLRELAATRRPGSLGQSVFAILPISTEAYPESPAREAAKVERFTHLRKQYGVHCIFYEHKSQDQTEQLSEFLKTLAKRRHEWWDSWRKIPKVRIPKFPVFADTAMFHHPQRCANDDTQPADLQAIDGWVCDPEVRTVIVRGRSGAGKTTLITGAVRDRKLGGLLHRHASRFPKAKQFVGSTHHTNELLSTLEAAAEHFCVPTTCVERHPVDRLIAALDAGDHLLVLGGFDRLLLPGASEPESEGPAAPAHPVAAAPASPPTTDGREEIHPLGRPASSEIEYLVKRLLDRDKGGTVVLLTTVVPDQLARAPNVRIHRVVGRATDRLTGADADLARALDGHAYALDVASRHHSDTREQDLRALTDDLWSRHLRRRAEIVVERAIGWAESGAPAWAKGVRETNQLGATVQDVLRVLVLLATPTTASTIAAALVRGSGRERAQAAKTVRDTLDLLVQRGLVLEIVGAGNGGVRYAAHTLVRHHVLRSLGTHPRRLNGPRRFILWDDSGETDSQLAPDPDAQAHAGRAVDAILDRVAPLDSGRASNDLQLIRGAFGLLRSQWSVAGVLRTATGGAREHTAPGRTHLEVYQLRLLRLLNAVRFRAGEGTWTDWRQDSQDQVRCVQTDGATLYADELSWVYNELGFIAYSIGSLHDAAALFESGRRVNRVAERATRGLRWCQSELSLAVVDLKRGQIERASGLLRDARAAALRFGCSELAGRILGYIGLTQILQGNPDGAVRDYDACLRAVEPSGNQRARSIFRRLRADALRSLGLHREAAADLSTAVRAAEAGEYPDLVHYARVAEAALMRAQGDTFPHEQVHEAITFARRMGLRKLEVDALKVEADANLELGEIDRAADLARAVLATSAELGMELRVTAALVLLGRIEARRQEPRVARELLLSAQRVASRQAYHLQAQRAEEERLRLDARAGRG